MGPDEMATVGALIGRALRSREDDDALGAIRAEVAELCAGFPPYPTLAAG
jgi:glycine/serine hydroxymethyltransferase